MYHRRLVRLDSGLRDDLLEMPLGLDPVEGVVAAEESPQFLSDCRHQSMGQVDLTLRVEDGSHDDLHDKVSESDEFCMLTRESCHVRAADCTGKLPLSRMQRYRV